MAYKQRQDSHIRQAPPRRQPQNRRSAQTKTRLRTVTSQPSSGGLFSTKLVVAIFFVFVFVYIGHSIWAFMTPGVNIMIVRMSTTGVTRSIPGIIIRDEVVYYADRTGHVAFRVQENERVGVAAHVASIVSDVAGAQVATMHLSNVEDMAQSTQARRPATYGTDSGVQRLNNNLTNMVNRRIHSFTALNLSEIYALREDLNRTITTRNQINQGSALIAWEPLAREYERHQAAYRAFTRNVYASGSGIMSRVIDGHETSFTRDMIGNLTRDHVREVMDYDILTPTSEVQEGDAIFKLVGNVWYIAAYMPNDMIHDFVEGAMRTVYLYNANTRNYEPHSLRVERIDYGMRYSLVVFRNTRHVADFMNQRNIRIRTTSGIRRGLKIPDTAIITRRHYRIPFGSIHGETDYYVLVLSGDGNTRVSVTFDESTDYYAYIPAAYGLTVGNLLVPRDPGESNHVLLTDSYVRVIHGVYVVDFGTVVFRRVNIGENSIEAGYVLLDPSLNQGISEFNNIVTDASTVVAGQIIR